MTFDPVARQRQQAVSAQAHVCAAHVKRRQAACRSQNRLHAQKALMEFLLLGKVG